MRPVRLAGMQRNRRGIKVEIHRQLDLGQTRLVEVVLSCFRITAGLALGMMVRLTRVRRLLAGIDEAREALQFQRVEMTAMRMRLQRAVMRVDVIGMVMMEHPETEMERPQQDEAVNQRRTKF